MRLLHRQHQRPLIQLKLHPLGKKRSKQKKPLVLARGKVGIYTQGDENDYTRADAQRAKFD